MIKHLVSTKVTFVLMVAFAVAMAVATFMENDHGTAVARAEVYESWWFELIMVWMAINFIAHIDHYKLLTAKRWPVGMFHIAFVLIVLGAGVTRYFGKEGTIHIREGATENTFLSGLQYLQLHEAGAGNDRQHFEKPLDLNGINFKTKKVEADLKDQDFTIYIDEYIKGAHADYISGKDTLFDIAIAIGEGREDYLIGKGETLNLGSLNITTSAGREDVIQVFKADSTWMIRSPKSMHLVEMSSQKMGVLKANEAAPLQMRTLYQTDSAAFLVKAIYEGKKLHYHAETDEAKAKELPDVIKMRVVNKEGTELLNTYSELTGNISKRHVFFSGDKKFTLAYGPRLEVLPFALTLRKFELDRYPGSQSPSGYASELTVNDHENSFEARVFMNNVLDYKGYRFYQASYDTDEKGTVLSVSQDRPGTYITYLGYFLLTVGMFFTLFAKGSRFSILNNRLKSLGRAKPAKAPKKVQKVAGKEKLAATAATFMLMAFCFQAQAHVNPPDVSKSVVPLEQAEAYGRLIVQDLDGRMKPLNTLANEIVRKLSGSSVVKIPQPDGSELQLTPEQFLLAVQMNPPGFSALPLIKTDPEKSAVIFKVLQHDPVKSISFRELLDNEGRYLLQELVEEANRLKPAERNEGHKELLKVDERFNIFYAILTGDFLKLFPNKEDYNNTWFTAGQHKLVPEEDALFVKSITPMYLSALQKGTETGNWEQAEETLRYINLYQQKAGEAVYPSENHVQAELWYNKLKLGNRLFGMFWLIGIVMLVLAIIRLFSEYRWISPAWKAGLILGWTGFAVFTFHLALRWYVAGHAPWSDGFEMLIFVAWGVLLSGLLFGSRSHFTVPIGLLFSGTLLFVAFLDWLNPEITNLMPVLNSYWLKIHVAVIVSGYAPLALAALLALLMLVLLLFKPASPGGRWWKSMQELSVVNEMSITIGLFLLTIGTFLGGVWANESWGRYWAWDPKETWALISIMIYGFILHLRLIPKFKNALLFNLVSLWSFSAVIMTSFGVNYYLSGLHSYASGDPVPVPQWVWWLVGVLLVISALAIMKYKNLPGGEKKDLLAV